MKKDILVTGASGFSGSHQVDKSLSAGYKVVAQIRDTSPLTNLAEALPSPHLTLAKLDLQSPEDVMSLIKTHQPNIIIHLAAHTNINDSIANPQKTLVNNLQSTLNLLLSATKYAPGSTIILTGSSHEFGTPDRDYPDGIDESIRLNPQNPYGQSKALENILIKSFIEQYGLRIVKARVFNHSGPRRPDRFLDGKLAKDATQAKIRGEKWVVKIGNRSYSRDWQHVHNWNDANLILSDYGNSGETYNVASGQPFSHEQFIDAVASSLGIQFEITEDNALIRQGDPLKTFANNQKLRSIGWFPKKNFEKMIEDSTSYWLDKLQG